MQPCSLKVGDIMQLRPERCGGETWFGGCLFVVSEPRAWGAQGYVKNAGEKGIAFYRAKWEDMEPTGGKAEWLSDHDAE